MADAGRILIMPKGNYNPSVSYEMLDLVFHNDVSWIAKKPVIGVEPSETNADYWFKMVDNSGLQNIINGTTPVGKAVDADTVDGYHAEDFATSADHEIKTINGLTQLGLTADSFVADDFPTNLTTIMTVLPSSSIYSGLISYSDFPNLVSSLTTKLNSDVGTSHGTTASFNCIITKPYTSNSCAEIKVMLDTAIGRNRVYTCIFDTSGGSVNISKFAESYNANGFLPLDGSVPMSGKTMELNKGWAKFEQTGGHLNVIMKQSADDGVTIDSKNMRWLSIYNAKDRAELKGALELTDYVNGSSKRYNVLHTANMKDYVLPLDGSVPMSGVLTVPEWIDVNSKNNNAQKARVGHNISNNNAYLINYDSTTPKWRGLSVDLSADTKEGLKYLDAPNGVETYHTVLHTANSAKVVVSSTPLTAEGSVRVW